MQFLTKGETRRCECGHAFGRYNPDGDTVRISHGAELYGLDNKVFRAGRAETWLYDCTNGKVRRVEREEECCG